MELDVATVTMTTSEVEAGVSATGIILQKVRGTQNTATRESFRCNDHRSQGPGSVSHTWGVWERQQQWQAPPCCGPGHHTTGCGLRQLPQTVRAERKHHPAAASVAGGPGRKQRPLAPHEPDTSAIGSEPTARRRSTHTWLSVVQHALVLMRCRSRCRNRCRSNAHRNSPCGTCDVCASAPTCRRVWVDSRSCLRWSRRAARRPRCWRSSSPRPAASPAGAGWRGCCSTGRSPRARGPPGAHRPPGGARPPPRVVTLVGVPARGVMGHGWSVFGWGGAMGGVGWGCVGNGVGWGEWG